MSVPRNMTDWESEALVRTMQWENAIETSCHPWWKERVEIYVLVTKQVDDLAQNQCHWIAQFYSTGDSEWISIGIIGGHIIVLYDKSIRALSDNNPSKMLHSPPSLYLDWFTVCIKWLNQWHQCWLGKELIRLKNK